MVQCMAKMLAINPKSELVSFWNCQLAENHSEQHELPGTREHAKGNGHWIEKQAGPKQEW